jgi:hypothetical protein
MSYRRFFSTLDDVLREPAMWVIIITLVCVVFGIGYAVWADLETGNVTHATAVIVDRSFVEETEGEDTRVGVSGDGNMIVIAGTSGDPEKYIFTLRLDGDRYERAEVTIADYFKHNIGDVVRIEIVEQNAGYYVRLSK